MDENRRLAREAIQIWTTGDVDAADDLCAPDHVNHQHHDPNDPRDLHGVEAIKTFATKFRQAFTDFRDSIDLVVTRFASMGTHRGTFVGVEPTNRELTWTGITIDRISEGELGELGHDGHDAEARHHLRYWAASKVLELGCRRTGAGDLGSSPSLCPCSPLCVRVAFSEVRRCGEERHGDT